MTKAYYESINSLSEAVFYATGAGQLPRSVDLPFESGTYSDDTGAAFEIHGPVTFYYDSNHSRVSMPRLQDIGYHGEYSTQWQVFQFTESAGALEISGKDKVGRKYSINLNLARAANSPKRDR